MKKLLIVLVALLAFSGVAWGDSYEALTVDATAGGVALTAATYLRARYALCRLETAEIRFTKDGTTAPTALVGVPMEPYEYILLSNPNQIRNFRAFRTTGTSGVLQCTFCND